MLTKLLRDCAGGSIVEFTLVFPMFILVALGTVDVSFMLSEWAQAHKATYIGAHRAIVSNPVAENLTAFFNDTIIGGMGLSCAGATGDPAINPSTGTQVCSTFVPIVCTSTTGTSTSCSPTTHGSGSSANFTNIFTPMQGVFPRLQPANVTISYQRAVNMNNLGYNEPNGFPMEVTATITGMTHRFYFIGPLVSFFGSVIGTTPGIPQFRTTLIGEDMCSDGTICGL